MKRIGRIGFWIVGSLVGIIAVFLLSVWISSGDMPEGGTTIAEKRWVNIGGIKQGYFLRGQRSDNPILLFLHGGPGSPSLPITHNIALEQYFTVCYWDQRGAGMTYSSDMDLEDFSIEQMIEDTRQLTDSLRKEFSVDKIYLMGHSWGSYLGVKTAERYPELYHAYIGIGQIANQRESERLGYDYVLNEARKQGDKSTVEAFEKVDKNAADFPTNSYLMGTRAPGMNKYGVGMMRKSPSMMEISLDILFYGGYTFQDKLNYLGGMKVSLDMLFQPLLSDNLMAKSRCFALPIYFCQGKYDYVTSTQLAKEYFELIDAPEKGFFLFEQSAHSPNIEEPEHFAECIYSIVKK